MKTFKEGHCQSCTPTLMPKVWFDQPTGPVSLGKYDENRTRLNLCKIRHESREEAVAWFRHESRQLSRQSSRPDLGRLSARFFGRSSANATAPLSAQGSEFAISSTKSAGILWLDNYLIYTEEPLSKTMIYARRDSKSH